MTAGYRFIGSLPWWAQQSIWRLRCAAAEAPLRDAAQRLLREQRDEMDRLHQLQPSFARVYQQLAERDPREFMIPFWYDTNVALMRRYLPHPPDDFLRDPVVQTTMFARRGHGFLDQTILEVKRSFPEDVVRRLLREDIVGRAPLAERSYPTSESTAFHAYHMARFFTRTKADPRGIRSVVEWGGGYGNQAKLFRRLIGPNLTYTIIDTPIFSAVQWLYLGSVFGQDAVHAVGGSDGSIVQGRINLVPVPRVTDVALTADLFVSTWALSESKREVQDLVAARSWFSARHLLIAHQVSLPNVPDAPHVGDLARAGGATIEPVGLFPANFYAFK